MTFNYWLNGIILTLIVAWVVGVLLKAYLYLVDRKRDGESK